jgi:hypothetical protein
MNSVEEDIGRREIGSALSELEYDATRPCECGMPMTPIAHDGGHVTVECANRHQHTVAMPSDPVARELVLSWIRRRGAQLHAQHERWEREREEDGA